MDNDTPYEQVTRGIRIRVFPQYSEDQSTPEEGYYFWTYTVEIANESEETVQLKSRLWRITDCARPHRGGPRPRRRRPDAGDPARTVVHLHVGLPTADAVGHHGRQLPDDGRGRRAVRRRHPRVLARQPLYGAQRELMMRVRIRDRQHRSPSRPMTGQENAPMRGPDYTVTSCSRASSPSTRRATKSNMGARPLRRGLPRPARRRLRARGRPHGKIRPRSLRHHRPAGHSRRRPFRPYGRRPRGRAGLGQAIPSRSRERDGRLYGRGTADMKGFLACVLSPVPDLQAAAAQNARPPHLLLRRGDRLHSACAR